MQRKINGQLSTKNCSEQLNSSRLPKSIKRIRIVGNQRQNIQTEQKDISYTQNQNDHQNTHHNHFYAHEFSFKKQVPNNTNKQNQVGKDENQVNNDEIQDRVKVKADGQKENKQLQIKIQSQQQQLKKLERMLTMMGKKLNSQQKQYQQVKTQYEGFDEVMQRNGELKMEILQLKELMKELIIQKDNHRMVLFSHNP